MLHIIIMFMCLSYISSHLKCFKTTTKNMFPNYGTF